MSASNGRPLSHVVVARVIKRAGGQTVLARFCGVSTQAVQQWFAKGRVPPLRVLECERASGVPRWQIRPDLYPPPDQAPDRSTQ